MHCCSPGLWEHATDQDSRDGSLCLLWHWPVRSSWRSTEPSALRICAASSGKPARAPGSRAHRGDCLRGQEAPQHPVRLLQQARGTYSEPVSVEMGGPGITDHVTAQASTNQTDTFDNTEARPTGPSLHPPFHTVVCRQCLKRLAPTWARCVHRQCLSAAIPAQHSRVLYGTLAGSSGKISRPKRVFPPVPHAVQCC